MDKTLDENLNSPAETVVGPSVKIQGDLNSEGNIKIEGQVSGKVKTSQSVFVVPGPKLRQTFWRAMPWSAGKYRVT